MVANMSGERLEAAFQQSQAAGLDPTTMFSKLMAYPGLLAKLRDPRIMRAFMDLSQNPNSLAKYRDEPDIVEVKGCSARTD